ncbi:MAG: transglutaminase-like domain-containing protein [Polyangiaceae bacterium]
MRFRAALALAVLALVVVARPALATTPGAVEHELIAPDARDDLQLKVVLDGDLPAAIETRSGILKAPDPRAPTTPGDPAFGSSKSAVQSDPDAKFTPDRDTRRPNINPEVDPFTPSIAPFERLAAYDAVHADYTLGVESPSPTPLSARTDIAKDGSEEQFFADLEVDVRPGAKIRIPSVGPDARVVHAHAGVGGKDVPFRLWHDCADNWFVEGFQLARIRLVMELTIARGSFGGEFTLDRWNDLSGVTPLPLNVQASAQIAMKAIGVSRAMPPRDALKKLVGYYRSFVDSKDPPQSSGDVYLDLTLSKKGVCRHRAFAFMITARALGIPARMIVSETHAWVEIRDAKAWRRIDLGGAGEAIGDRKPTVQFQTPRDPFSWPSNANRGEDLAPSASSAGGGSGSSSSSSGTSAAASASASPSASAAATTATTLTKPEKDDRPGSKVTLTVGDTDMRRGSPMKVSGMVTAEDDACPNLVVDIVFRDERHHELSVGSVATDDKGAFTSSIVVPANVPVGDYDVIAHTRGDARCGAGISN